MISADTIGYPALPYQQWKGSDTASMLTAGYPVKNLVHGYECQDVGFDDCVQYGSEGPAQGPGPYPSGSMSPKLGACPGDSGSPIALNALLVVAILVGDESRDCANVATYIIENSTEYCTINGDILKPDLATGANLACLVNALSRLPSAAK